MDAVTDFLHRCGAAVRRHPLRLLWLLLLVPIGAAFAVALYIMSMVPRSPSVDAIRTVRSQQPTVLLSADGKELAVFRRTNREWVELSDVSPKVIEALLATEDHRFYEHKGLDLRRTIGAAWRTARGNLQGGSTISQQLARNMFPEEIGRAPTIDRKVKEAITALRIESLYGKDEILEIYLNTVPFLYNAYGIEMAARTYFDRSAGDLDLIQASTLIGMLKGTSYYNPVLNPERAVQRRNLVLAQLVKHGKLDAAEYERLVKRPLGLQFEKQDEPLGPAPHLAQQLKRWLISWADKNGYNIHADGLVVRTTIDSSLQEMAVAAVEREANRLQGIASKAYAKPTRNKQLLDALMRDTSAYQGLREAGLPDDQALKKLEADKPFVEALWREKTQLQAALLVQEPSTGHVKAWVGSRDFRQDQFDHVQQAKRQPGSTFKPFVYGAAFDMGMSPVELFIDEPREFPQPDKSVWAPRDVSEPTYQPMTLRDGLAFSRNTITAQLVQRVGADRVAALARAMGVRQSKLEEVPSLALGTSPVTLKEMVSAYATIAQNGTYVEPVLVLRIENRKGEVIEQFQPRAAEQALPLRANQQLLDAMRGVIDRGTGAPIRSRWGLQGDFAGKTGTTQDNTDGWFILMHPQLVAGSWVGFNDARITMANAWGQGSQSALPIVGNFYQQVSKARLLDTKVRFNAPRDNSEPDPEALARLMETVQSGMAPAPVQAQSPGVWPEGLQSPDAVATTPRTITINPPPVASRQPDRAAERPSDFSWSRERQRSRDYQDSPGFAAPAPDEPPYVVRVPPQGQMGAGPYWEPVPPPSPGEGGIRILRSY